MSSRYIYIMSPILVLHVSMQKFANEHKTQIRFLQFEDI